MPTKSPLHDTYNQVWCHLNKLAKEMKDAGIPNEDVPPAVADFLIIAILAMTKHTDLGPFAVEAILTRQQQLYEAWMRGEHPFDEGDFNGKHLLSGEGHTKH